MRISDWSSDVCSSDLEPTVRRTNARARAPDTPGQRRRARFDTTAAPRAPYVAPASSFLSLSIARSSLHQGSRRSGKVFILLHVFAGVGHVDRHRDALPASEIGRAHVCTPVTNSPLLCRLTL